MLRPSQAIGVLGGTFAPIHHGHLRIAIEARERLGLGEVRLIPASTPPHRPAPAVPGARRLEWVRRAIAGEAGLVADDRELRRGGTSYTFDTLADLRREFPAAPICLLIGADALAGLHTWNRAAELTAFASIVIFSRPAAEAGAADSLSRHWPGARVVELPDLLAQPNGVWCFCRAPQLEISSTQVRRLLKAGRSVRGLVAEPVLQSFTSEDVEQLTRNEIPPSD